MQQFSQICLVSDHFKQKEQIKYVCVHSLCVKDSRFLCSACVLENIHSHNQQNNYHILDTSKFKQRIMNEIFQAQGKVGRIKYNIQKLIAPLRQIIQEINNFINNIKDINEQIEGSQIQTINIRDLKKQLLEIDNHYKLINMSNQIQYIDMYKSLEKQSNLIIENALTINSQVVNSQKSLVDKLKQTRYQIQQIDQVNTWINTGAISNDLKYIVSGGQNYQLKIWDYRENKLIRSIKFNLDVTSCKFTEDSKLLYVGIYRYIYQFDVDNQFNQLCQEAIHTENILNIFCISNQMILTASKDRTIIKTDFHRKQQLFKIKAHDFNINGLDYHKFLNIIASGSNDKSIKLWNGSNGQLFLEKQNAHNNNQNIKQVLFIINNNQVLSQDSEQNLFIWNINQLTKQLEQQKQIMNFGKNISLVQSQEYIVATGKNFIKVYQINGELVHQFDHDVDDFCRLYYIKLDFYNSTQPNSMKAVLIVGKKKLQVCKLDMD